jgi:glyceraldehyde 3-phosphate dehydrogenase
MAVRVGVNGFGRMGRALLRASLTRDLGIEVVAVNDLIPSSNTAILLVRDSVYGRLHRDLKVADDGFLVEGGFVRCFTEKDPSTLPWAEADVEVVVEATGRFRTREAAAAHLGGPVRRVVVSAPCKDADATVVLGVNTEEFDPGRHQVVSNASCTTNCLAPMIKVLDDSFGLEQGFITTVHAYTGDQMLVDGLHKDLRRARAATVNIVPTSTGAARATGLVLASMQGRLDGTALRVPVPDGSITDLVALVSREVTVDEVDAAFEVAASGSLNGILEHSHGEPLVSSDIIGSNASCVYDSALTMASGRLVKVYGWYDNEWGYANRLGELAALAGRA